MKKNHDKISIRHVMTRIAAVFTSIAAVVVMLPAIGVRTDAYTFTDGDYRYTISAGTGKVEATIVKYEPLISAAGGSAAIPQTLGGYTVTEIAANAFVGNADLKSVTMPATIKSIGVSAFQNCTSLENITIPQGITEISDYCFKGCSSLKTVNLPTTITKIGYEAFSDCLSLEEAPLPAGIATVSPYAFKHCTSLKKVNMPSSLTSVGIGAFESCTLLSDLTLSTSLTTIEDYCFFNCTSLSVLNLPNSLTSIGRYAFAECVSADRRTGISSVEFPLNLTSIGASAFQNCTLLALAIMRGDITSISDSAFSGTPVEIYGYSGSYVEQFANRNRITFHSYGSIYTVTFSADIYNATVNNILIRSSAGTVIPPASVAEGETLTISATAPDGYDINYITVNGVSFTNGSTYRVSGGDVNIFVSYRRRDETTTAVTIPLPVTSVTTVTTTAPVTSVLPTTTLTTTVSSADTSAITATLPSDEDTTEPADDGSDDSFLKVNNDLEDISGEKVNVSTQREYFTGPATVRLTNTAEALSAAESAIESIDSDNPIFYAFDISLYDSTGKENQGVMTTGTITFQIPVPNRLLKYADNLSVYHIADEMPELLQSRVITDSAGVKRIQFDSDSFSPYMIVAETEETVPIYIDDETTKPADNSGNTGNNTKPYDYGGGINPHTGVIIAAAVPAVTLTCVLLVRKQKRKRTKSSNDR